MAAQALGRVPGPPADVARGLLQALHDPDPEVRDWAVQGLRRCEVSEELLKLNDREMLEDLIRGAVNQALKKVRQLVADETSKMATGLGMPQGMGLPGME